MGFKDKCPRSQGLGLGFRDEGAYMAAGSIVMKVFWKKKSSFSFRPLPSDEGTTFKALMTFTWPEYGLTVFWWHVLSTYVHAGDSSHESTWFAALVSNF